MLVDYNAHMNKVDKLHQMKSTYELDKSAKSGDTELYFINCVVNTYVLYKKIKLPKMTMKDFRRGILRNLVSNLTASKK